MYPIRSNTRKSCTHHPLDLLGLARRLLAVLLERVRGVGAEVGLLVLVGLLGALGGLAAEVVGCSLRGLLLSARLLLGLGGLAAGVGSGHFCGCGFGRGC